MQFTQTDIVLVYGKIMVPISCICSFAKVVSLYVVVRKKKEIKVKLCVKRVSKCSVTAVSFKVIELDSSHGKFMQFCFRVFCVSSDSILY